MRSLSFPHAEVRVYPEATLLSRAAADEIDRAARAARAARGRFTLVLSGGSTPKSVYALLARDHAGQAARWDQVQVFFGDERLVPADHPESNYRMAQEAWLGKEAFPPDRVHRVRTELGPRAAARDYEEQIRQVFELPAGLPRFDLVLLGMGPDGHTASLFPGNPTLAEREALVATTVAEKPPPERITLTFPVLNAAAEILFLVAGADKAAMLRKVLHGDPTGRTYPAQSVRPSNGRLLWLVDESAAREL
jgi:6-phosphogluconolactonase